MILPMSSARVPSASMISPEERIVVLIRFKPSVAFSMVPMPLCTSSRERFEMSSRTLAVSATRWIEVTIWSIEAEVSLTLEACVCVLFTMFCTFTLISCMVLVTSSMAEEVCRLFLADSSEELATWVEALATCEAASRTLRTSPRRPSTMRVKALARVSLAERGRTSTARLPPAMASETAAISFRYFTMESKVRASCPISSLP